MILKWIKSFFSRKEVVKDLEVVAKPIATNRKAFFDLVRRDFGSLTQKQVNGFNYLLDAYYKIGWINKRWLAYILATAWHETARTMMPIEEYGKGKGRPYGKPGKYGQSQHGRGYVQLTWDSNYERADKELWLKGALLKNFDLAMRPDIAAEIIFRGMKDGWFTGKGLATYINTTKVDYKNARRIVNGTDKAGMIAEYAKSFERAVGTL